MEKISASRKLIYILIGGALPLFFVLLHLYSDYSFQNNLSVALDDAIQLSVIKNKKERANREVKRMFSNADHFYIDKEIETLEPLQQEKATLQALISRGFHPDEEEIKKRLQFLSSGQNRIVFSEGAIKSSKDYQETVETLTHPIEVDFDDVKRIIGRIEATDLDSQTPSATRPHLIITECKLEKKHGLSQDVFLLDLKVLKREYVK